MVTTASRLRQADPAREVVLPEVDSRARAELQALVGDAERVRPTRIPSRPTPRRVVTGVVAALLAAGTIAVVGVTSRAPQPASPSTTSMELIAQRVTFGNAALSARYERAVEQLALGTREGSSPSDRVFSDAVEASPQLRVDARYGGVGTGGFHGVGSRRFDLGSSPDDLGGRGSGADAVDVFAMRCAGEARYQWRILGHAVGSTRGHLIATATGTCGPGLTAARYVLPGDTIATTLEVDLPEGQAFGLANIGYTNFGAPKLDGPYPKN